MESSEDDAGAAASASRRASAREKYIGQAEDVHTTTSQQQDPESRISCKTPIMTEDNFDGDSVSSPSAQDVNTSTEAILDMIDEIVDGPDAPKRRSFPSEVSKEGETTHPQGETESEEQLPLPDVSNTQPSVTTPTTSAKSDTLESPNLPESKEECKTNIVSGDEDTTQCIKMPQAVSSGNESVETIKDMIPEVSATISETPSKSPNVPSSSKENIVTKTTSDCGEQVRTMKCVTSSDNQDNVIVESAQSTSRGKSFSEAKPIVLEPVTRVPLRRRLVRPPPCERRPDSTVSSTVDSHCNKIAKASSDCVTKDVSSSSDALSAPSNADEARQGNSSICKAETSVSPPKKIKLIRQKFTPQPVSKADVPQEMISKQQCQSTSSDCVQKSNETGEGSLSISSSSKLQTKVTTAIDSSVSTLGVQLPEKTEEKITEENQHSATVQISSDKTVSTLPATIEKNLTSSLIEKENKSLQKSDEIQSYLNIDNINEPKVPPIKLCVRVPDSGELSEVAESIIESCSDNSKSNVTNQVDASDSTKQVPKLTIKLGNKSTEEVKSTIPKLTIKPIKPPVNEDKIENDSEIPSVTKLNIKPIPKPAKKINDVQRKSSSSEISEESESSENDESNSTSDQTSASEQGSSDVVPKVTIKLGKPGTESEGKFYTEQNIPKLTIKGIQHSESDDRDSKLKLVISQHEDKQQEKIPKLTIKTVTKAESQQMSPKLTIKPLKPPENISKDVVDEQYETQHVPKLKISTEFKLTSTAKEIMHVPKITIKPVVKLDSDNTSKSPKKSAVLYDSPEHIPVVTKLNIKPIVKPMEVGDSSESTDKVPVVSKLNIKPVIKPKDTEEDCNIDSVPKVTKLHIKPIKTPEEISSEKRDCDVSNDGTNIPVVTKINIKPIVKPVEHVDEDSQKDSENQSSETGNSSDDNTDIPIVTKINIKPILKPNDLQDKGKSNKSNEENVPIITKLNIKPIVKPDESPPPTSEGKCAGIPVVTKLNIKPLIKPDHKNKDEIEDTSIRNPPLLMKINMKAVTEGSCNESIIFSDNKYNNSENSEGSLFNTSGENIPVVTKLNIKPVLKSLDSTIQISTSSDEQSINSNCDSSVSDTFSIKSVTTEKNSLPTQNCVPDSLNLMTQECSSAIETLKKTNDIDNIVSSVISFKDSITKESSDVSQSDSNAESATSIAEMMEFLNKYTNEDEDESSQNSTIMNVDSENVVDELNTYTTEPSSPTLLSSHFPEVVNPYDAEVRSRRVSHHEKVNDEVRGNSHNLQQRVNNINTSPLEVNVTEITSQCSGQPSPRIILKINKTDHGSSAKIITEDSDRSNTQQELTNNISTPKKNTFTNSRRRPQDSTPSVSVGKRLRSSRIVENTDKIPSSTGKRNVGKKQNATESGTNESELSVLETKRLKLGQLLSNKSLTMTPVISKMQISPTNKPPVNSNQGIKPNHTSLTENIPKNGNSKLHNILSNLQPFKENCIEKRSAISPELESSTSAGSLDATLHSEVQEMIINENSESHDFSAGQEDISQDPLEMDHSKRETATSEVLNIPKLIEMTPQPKKRGRPRKLPVSEGAKPITLPVLALEERPQRSLRLSRDRPAIIVKPRGGRGRGRGQKRQMASPTPVAEPLVDTANKFFVDEQKKEEIDPTSSRIKLPRLTEALDKMPSACVTPLSSRRRGLSELKLFGEQTGLLESKAEESVKSPESAGRARGGRGRGGRGRTPVKSPRVRGRGRGGGRGAMYMKETMGIYGRVCGPATTTVQLFEEETCMMDDNATPAKPSHLLDEDSQSSVKSSTNESSKMKKSKFADLFDSNKVWTAADVKEYMWPPPERREMEHQIMMIQEQVAMFLGVKSFKRRYPELKRRTITGDERDYVLGRGLVTEALCDLGITAVDASEVLDIMLSDYPHKYEEYRSHQRQKQLAHVESENTDEVKPRIDKVEMKIESRPSDKPEPPKIDPEKARQDMAALAIASASEWNARLNASRRPACADLQTLTIHRRRPPTVVAPNRLPAGMYPHAFLPGQYQHWYRVYTSEELRYFPLNTVLSAPPATLSQGDYSSESEDEWGSNISSTDESDGESRPSTKRKKLMKVKRSSQVETKLIKEELDEEEVALCTVCKLRLEANRRSTHERFLVCSTCTANFHPTCVDLNADTIRKCREYAWQCPDCKCCVLCTMPADADKMLCCELCDRGFHAPCVGLHSLPPGRWHCTDCAICKSCGARDPVGLPATGVSPAPSAPAEWHHQTRRGPGGHKVYSHSLCTPCARAYRIGRYCPLCDRSFIGPKGTMQLVICKLCDRQLHQECVRQTVSNLNVLDYTCGECRRGGITSRAAAVRLAPRTIATLFMAKRRFNKYAHRQYMQSRLQPKPASENSNDVMDDQAETVESVERPDDASDVSEPDASDPLDGAGDETRAAVESLRLDFGD